MHIVPPICITQRQARGLVCRQLAVKHALQTRRNLNLTASTPGIVPSPHVETPVQPPKADKVEVV